MGRIISKILSVLIIFGGLFYTGYTLSQDTLLVLPLNTLPQDYVETNYVGLEDNMGKTTMNGIANIYINLQNEGFTIQSESRDSSEIDVVFVRDDEVRRYNYNKNSKILTYLFNPYEDTHTGSSYINERDV